MTLRTQSRFPQIVKSLIFRGRTSGADADFVRAVTGCAIGGAPPIGHNEKMETYLDEDFLKYQAIWAAAGTPNAIFELKTEDLQKMTDGKVAGVK